MSNPSYTKKILALAFAASQIGFMMAAGFLVGLWADKSFRTAPWLALLGLIAGFTGGVRILILLARSHRDESKPS